MFKIAFKAGIWWGIGLAASAFLILSSIIGVLRFAFDSEYKGGLGWNIFFGLLGVAFLVWDIITYRKSVKMLDEADDDIDYLMANDYGIFIDADQDKADDNQAKAQGKVAVK